VSSRTVAPGKLALAMEEETGKRLANKGRGRLWDRPITEAITALDSLEHNGRWTKHFPTSNPIAA
jgi:hypothetical protein